jgi:hypothetical protein
MQRPRLENVTGDAPMRRIAADYSRITEVTPRMAFLRRSRKNVRATLLRISLKVLMWRYRDRDALRKSHIRIIGATAPFGRNPGNILIGILDVTGFAVDAILRVDHEFWCGPFLNPFVDTGWAVTRRGARENVMLGFFL